MCCSRGCVRYAYWLCVWQTQIAQLKRTPSGTFDGSFLKGRLKVCGLCFLLLPNNNLLFPQLNQAEKLQHRNTNLNWRASDWLKATMAAVLIGFPDKTFFQTLHQKNIFHGWNCTCIYSKCVFGKKNRPVCANCARSSQIQTRRSCGFATMVWHVCPFPLLSLYFHSHVIGVWLILPHFLNIWDLLHFFPQSRYSEHLENNFFILFKGRNLGSCKKINKYVLPHPHVYGRNIAYLGPQTWNWAVKADGYLKSLEASDLVLHPAWMNATVMEHGATTCL